MDGKRLAAQWTCECGNALGFIDTDSAGVTRLAVYREPIDFSAESPAEVDVLLTFMGDGRVRCICGRTKAWEPNFKTLTALMDRLNNDRLMALVRRVTR